ncbi:MAG: repeat containing protein [Chthonomonadaceae bacterium]|nr:repeat containing protein [Chthonomonadaceae bacterium]
MLDLINTRIVQMDDMTGKNWRTLDIPGIDMHSGEPHAIPGRHDSTIATAAELPNVVVDTHDRLYYPDQKLCCVRRVDDISGKNPVTLGTPRVNAMHNGMYTSPNPGKGRFAFPQMIGLDSQDRLYVLSVPGSLIRVDDMTGKNWTDIYFAVPGIAKFIIVDGNTLYAPSFGPYTDIRTETPDGKIAVTKWKPPLNRIIDISAR